MTATKATHHHFIPKGLEWNLLTGKKPALRSTVLVHNGHLDDKRFPVVAHWDGFKFLRSSGRAYGEEDGINQWADAAGIEWPILAPGLYKIRTAEECVKIFKSLERRLINEGKPLKRPRLNCSTGLAHLSQDYASPRKSAGAKRLGLKAKFPFIHIYIFDDGFEQDDRFAVPNVYEMDLMVECECGHSLTDHECLGKDPIPTPAEIEERKSSACHDPESQRSIELRRTNTLKQGGRSNV